MVDVGVGEQPPESDLIETVSAGARLIEMALEDGQGLVVATPACVAAAQGAGSCSRVTFAERTRIEGLLEEADRIRNVGAIQSDPAETKLCPGKSGRGVRSPASRFIEPGRLLFVSEP